MKRYLSILWGAVLLAGCCAFAYGAPPVQEGCLKKLVRRLQPAAGEPGRAAMNRLRWMRFYLPTVKIAEREGFWERLFHSFSEADKQRAVASYLYQMYISSAVYGGEIPPRLTVNYLGVLNGLERLEANFDAREALAYYQKNKAEIKKWLVQFFKEAALPVYQPENVRNDITEKAFLKTLARSTLEHGRAGYVLAAPRWNEPLPQADQKWLQEVQRLAAADIRQKVVLYEENAASLSSLDKLSGQYTDGGKVYLFRPAGKECAACSYLTCSRVCRQVQAQPSRNWGLMQVYQLQLRPLKASQLRPASGTKFFSPQGKAYPDWFYHEAVLVILNHGKRHIPVVLDPFLAEGPMAFSQWLAHFSPQHTVLYAYPFQRWSDTEERLVRPDKVKGNKIWKDGRSYKPYPVEY